MEKIRDFLNCGRLVKYDNMMDYCVENNNDCLNKIIPFFSNGNNILGVKAKDFEDWIRVANIIAREGYLLTKQDVEVVSQRDSIDI